MKGDPSSSSFQETLVPLRDDDDANKRRRHNSDAETVSSAPPRIEVEGDSLAVVHDVTKGDNGDNVDSSKDETKTADIDSPRYFTTSSPLIIAPLLSSSNSSAEEQSASTRKFVTFLSDVDGTPIATKRFVEDDNDIDDVMKNDVMMDPSFMEDGDEKKEEHAITITTTADNTADITTPNTAVTLRGYGREYSESTLDSWQNNTEESQSAPLIFLHDPLANNNNDDAMMSKSDLETLHTPPSRLAAPPAIDTTNHNNHNTELSQTTYASRSNRRSITLRLVEEVTNNSNNNSNNNNNVNSLHSNVLTTPFKRLTSLRKFRSLSLSTVMIPSDENKNTARMDMTDRQNNNNSNSNNNNKNDPRIGTNNDNGDTIDKGVSNVERGTISVTWYEGTTSKEMRDHVYNCVLRKLRSSVVVGNNNNNNNGGHAVKKKTLEDVRLLDENVVPHEGLSLCLKI